MDFAHNKSPAIVAAGAQPDTGANPDISAPTTDVDDPTAKYSSFIAETHRDRGWWKFADIALVGANRPMLPNITTSPAPHFESKIRKLRWRCPKLWTN